VGQQAISVNLVIGLLEVLNELVVGEGRSQEEVLALVMASGARFPQQSLVQTLVGDIFAELGQSGPATDAWSRALDIERHKSAPIANRLINELLDDGSIHRAFEQAVEVAGRTQTIQGAVLLCRSWMALQSAGIPPQSVVPGFTLADSPLEFIENIIKAVEKSGGDAMFLQPLLAQAAVRSGEIDLANRIISEALTKEASISILLPLSQASLRGDLDREAEILTMIRDLDVENDFEDEILILQSSILRKNGEAAEAFALSEAYFENRSDERSRRLRQMEILDGLAAGGVSAKQAMEILMASDAGDLDDGMLSRLLTGMIDAEDRELAQKVLQRMAIDSDGDSAVSSSLALGLARFTLAFDRDVNESVTAAILRLDPIVSAGASTIEHELTMVELLGLQNPPKTTRAIEVLRDSVRRRPGRFDTTLRLISFLQKAGRFEEAEELLAEVWRRRESAPPQVRRLIPRLMSGQGDVDEIMASQCELAQETGNPVDRLACIRARYRAGAIEEADADLDSMMMMAERPVAVDMEAASRCVRRGDVDGAIKILQTAGGFGSSLDRTRAVGSLLLRTNRLEELDALLLEMVEVTANSADLQILICLRELAFDPPRFQEADLALARALELGRDRSEILQRVLTIRVENPELRDGADEAVDLLSRMNPEEARLLDLALRVPVSEGGFKPSVAQLEESKAILEIQADNRAAWLLAINLHLGVLEKALVGAWPDEEDLALLKQRKSTRTAERQRLQVAVVDLLISATSRFPGDMLFPVQLSEVYLRLGRLSEALSSAREGLRRAGSGRKLGNAIPVALIEARLDRPDLVLATLEPFQDEVKRNPNPRPRAWRLLVQSLLLEGRVEEAWALFRSYGSKPDPTVLSLVWLETASKASPRIATAAIEKAKEMIPPGMGRLRFAGAGLAAFGRTGDASLRMLTEEILSEIMATGPSTPNALQVELIGTGIIAFSSELDAIRNYQDILSRIPPAIMEDFLVFPALDERRKSIAGPYFNPAVMAMNNMAAIIANMANEGNLPLDQAAKWLEVALEASTRLMVMVPDSPEVIDTRAMVAIAAGDGADALEFARQAVAAVPDRASFRWTLARALDAEGQSAAAVEEAREANQLLRRSEEKDEDLARKLSNFLSRN
jgi:tetratricopeptide (TPR) repeat protein